MSIPPRKVTEARRARSDTPTSEAAGSDRAFLIVVGGSRIGARHDLPADRAILGRSHDAAVPIEDREVSRQHALIVRDAAGKLTIHDLESSNGTFVNGRRVTRHELAPGDRIQLGSHVLLFSRHSETQRQVMERQRLEALGRITAGVVHDFNNMLAVVLANCDALLAMEPQARASDPMAPECLHDIRAAAIRAHDLARRWLAFGRSSPTDYRPIDVAVVCRDVCGLLRASIPRSVQIDCKAQAEAWVLGDLGDLHQVMVNLMINARDAMPEGRILRVGAAHRAKGRAAEVVVSVADSGTGMDKETRARIFEPFFTTKQATGFGLGLSTVREIVEAHGGAITVASAPKKGTTFEIVLPALGEASLGRVASSMPPVMIARGRKAVVLVIDDEESVRRSVSRILGGAGHEVVEATDGREGIKRYLERAPPADLVLLNLDMPVLGGIPTLGLLRRLEPTVRVVICGGLVDGRRDELLAQGAIGVLSKPFGADELLRAVAGALGERERDTCATQDLTKLRQGPPRGPRGS
jgi:signal transduction histidine kinase/CheY-like chemotaxis protein